MNLSENTILITGGSEGIGLALARRLAENNTVIVCARTEEKLRRAVKGVPRLNTHACDLTRAVDRQGLVDRLLADFPDLNVIINNAGAKTATDLHNGFQVESALTSDMALNFTAPVALTTALLPQLRSRPNAAVVNVTTGLVYLAKAEQAFYCAAKSALHSYTQALRWACRDTRVEVFEALLSLVDTGFHRGHLPTNVAAMSADDAAVAVIRGLRRGQQENHVGKARFARWLSFLAPSRGMVIVNR